MKNRYLRVVFDLILFALGFLSLLAPFIFQQARNPGFSSASFPMMVSFILILCLLLIIFEAQSSFLDSKMIAFLGILIALNAGLRFMENAIPGPAGFSPIFFLIILTGYSFGSRIGFLMGAMTIFISSLITGGVGPWLPGQMITAGWIGQSSALLKPFVHRLRFQDKPGEIILLSIFGAFWGMFFGIIMNLWFWPFYSATPDHSWLTATGLIDNIGRYAAYYLSTSIVWDVTRSIGNILVISVFSKPVLRVFNRFKTRFSFKIAE